MLRRCSASRHNGQCVQRCVHITSITHVGSCVRCQCACSVMYWGVSMMQAKLQHAAAVAGVCEVKQPPRGGAGSPGLVEPAALALQPAALQLPQEWHSANQQRRSGSGQELLHSLATLLETAAPTDRRRNTLVLL